jgi:hypothetical protein
VQEVVIYLKSKNPFIRGSDLSFIAPYMLLLINLNKILYPVIDIRMLLSTSTRSTSTVNLLPLGLIFI